MRIQQSLKMVAAAAVAAGLTVSLTLASAAPRRGGTLRIAEVGEPLTLDTVATTADLTSIITLPIFEELFAFDSSWRIQPFLAESYTESQDGLTYTFKLRRNVPFHNGKEMMAEDVVASLERWGKVSPRGTSVYKNVESTTAADKYTVVMKLKAPFAPLLSFVALPNGAAAIMPKEIADATGTGNLKQYVGTGPYRFVEWAPDRYVKLARFDKYAARPEPANGYAGRRDALADQVFFYPVSQVATRIAGVQSGDYDIADAINQDAYEQLTKDSRVSPGIVKPGNFLTFFFNKKQGMMTNEKLRQAVEVALDMGPIMKATFGDPKLYSLGPSVYPQGTPYYTIAGSQWYNVHDPAKAKTLMKEAGYNGAPVRWLATQQYDYMFKSTTVAKAQLEQVGFKVDMQVLEWAGVLDHRSKPADYDLFTTGHGFVPDPALITVFNSAYPGWWDSPEKNRLFDRFNQTPNPGTRTRLWPQLQALWYEQAPLVRPGEFYTVVLASKAMAAAGFKPTYWLIPWNVTAVK